MSLGPTPHGRLTPAQTGVIAGYARGHRMQQVAAELGISPRAVRGHVSRAARRTGIEGRSLGALVDHAYRHGDFDTIPDLAIKTQPVPPALRMPRSLRRTLQCIARGLSTSATAQELGVSRATAREYRRRLYEQLGTTLPPRAVALGWQWRLLGAEVGAPAERIAAR
ncbi:LuxR C-terminal-related transcriptional regulator [Streptomyces prunicolor]|uniref:LuxR C-terminal-related transcriptional regulator n=1 Tax=Streptomyces prunicolor TaxID=67348 RepID=UPI002259E697|nr:LuxR C-terminal-related transcriptional regulator [Streptomyces prunicolor]MCX5239751.1 LuxR C-terminal-related transcriptional regulator [Streptomyces prunicolor]